MSCSSDGAGVGVGVGSGVAVGSASAAAGGVPSRSATSLGAGVAGVNAAAREPRAEEEGDARGEHDEAGDQGEVRPTGRAGGAVDTDEDAPGGGGR